MAEDWALDVRKYAPAAEDAAIAGIVKHCGIALRSRDASLVSFTDPQELSVVRESFCRKKLGLTDPDEVIDGAIAHVGERMKADHTKNRVTVYYLLAEHFGKLGLFGGAAAAAVAAAPAVAEPVKAAPIAAAAAPLAFAAAAPAAAAPQKRRSLEPSFGFAALVAGAVAGIFIGGAILASLISHHGLTERREPAPAPLVTPAAPAAPVVAAPEIPTGAGVIAVEEAGKPKLSVYFDTAKYDVSPDFATVAAPIKAYMDAHPGAKLALSGYNDPRGDAKFNAELSKNRAKAVLAALVALGVPDSAIDLVKPADTTDSDVAMSQARRVDISVEDAPAAQ
jgi:outer membrane protein OmpA-like peptidoglycan-associated protein